MMFVVPEEKTTSKKYRTFVILVALAVLLGVIALFIWGCVLLERKVIGDEVTVKGKITSIGEILGYTIKIDSVQYKFLKQTNQRRCFIFL